MYISVILLLLHPVWLVIFGLIYGISKLAKQLRNQNQNQPLQELHPPRGRDVYITLPISRAEAQMGTVRSVTVAGGRQVNVAVPAGTAPGQEFRQEGQGEPSPSGGPAGTLIVTIAVVTPPRASAAPPLPPTQGMGPTVPSPNIPHLGTSTPLPLPLQSMGQPSLVPPLQPSGPLSSKQGVATNKGRLALLIGGVVFMVVGSISASLFFSNRGNSSEQVPSQQQATSQENPYTHSGTLVLDDPLRDNSSGYNWPTLTYPEGSQFIEGAYHVSARAGSFSDCLGHFTANTTSHNFAYEVEMTIVRGDAGGLDPGGFLTFYLITPDGKYSIYDRLNGNVLNSGSSTTVVTMCVQQDDACSDSDER